MIWRSTKNDIFEKEYAGMKKTICFLIALFSIVFCILLLSGCGSQNSKKNQFLSELSEWLLSNDTNKRDDFGSYLDFESLLEKYHLSNSIFDSKENLSWLSDAEFSKQFADIIAKSCFDNEKTNKYRAAMNYLKNGEIYKELYNNQIKEAFEEIVRTKIAEGNLSFSDKIKLIDTMESLDYTDMSIVTFDDVKQFILEKMSPVYTEPGQGGYYDTHTIKEYHFNKTESMSDIITAKGQTGEANTIDVTYRGDFASHTFQLDYVDRDDYYTSKTMQIWRGYFKGKEINTTPEVFRSYRDFWYAPPYLFAYNGSQIDVYDELGNIVLRVKGNESNIEELTSVQSEK